MANDLTAERLRERLDYDPATGVFRWRASGSLAGTPQRGYRIIKVDGVRVMAHRLAWLYVHGKWPPEQIDHANLERDDNRIANLRQATNQLNSANRRARKQSGLKGAFRDRGRWRSMIKVDGRIRHLGQFDSPESAHAAYLSAAQEAFGEFARAA